MNKTANYIIIAVVVATVLFLAWYFASIVAYVLISAVLALIFKPIVVFFKKLDFRGKRLPSWVAGAVGLLSVWTAFYLFFRFSIPLIADQAKLFAKVDITGLVDAIIEPLDRAEGWINTVLPSSKFSIQTLLESKITGVFNSTMLISSFGSIANFLVSMAVAIFAVSFITFFFMKEETLFIDSLTVLLPARYESGVRHAWKSSTGLLTRYFVGVIIDMLCLLIVIALGLTLIAKQSLTTALLIGLIAGVLNVIPYVGPLIAAGIGLLITIAGGLDGDGISGYIVIRVLMVFIVAKLLDDAIFQPLIFANSIKAHPLEIFMLILIAGSVAGIGGMLLAIPAYTVLRVFAKEFFNNLRLVRKLTERI